MLPSAQQLNATDGFTLWRVELPPSRGRAGAVYRVTTLEHGTLVSVETWLTHRRVRGSKLELAVREAVREELHRLRG